MQTKMKVIITVLVVGLLAFVLAPQAPLGSQLWPEPNHDVQAEGAQVPLFMLIGLIEGLAMGIAVAFAVFGWPYTKRLAGATPGLAPWLHGAIVWSFGNFWVHDNVHFINGMDLWGLLVIDYVFHVTLMASGILVAWAVIKLASEETGAAAT